MEFKGKKVFVTGGSAGIGKATALKFLGKGADVAILGYTQSKLESLKEYIGEQNYPGDYYSYKADVSDAAQVNDVLEKIKTHWDKIDILFVNAGINGVWAPIDDIEPEEWERTVSINLNGAFHTIKYALPLMKKNGGAIVIDSSACGVNAFTYKGMAAYGSTKAALVGLTRILAVELAQYKIRVNAIKPGPTATDIFNLQVTRNTDRIKSWASYPWVDFEKGELPVPLADGQLVTAEQVADSVLFLASDAAAMVTGTCIDIDGAASLIQ